jgi:hypothetical protein
MDFEKRRRGHYESMYSYWGNAGTDVADADQYIHRKVHLPSVRQLSFGLVSVSEMIVMVRYVLHQCPISKNEAVARDTVYELFTIIFLLLLNQVVGDLTPSTTSNPILLEWMKEEIRNHVRNTVDGTIKTNGGEQYTPSMGPVLRALLANPGSGLTQATSTELMDQEDDERKALNVLLQDYVAQLQQQYGSLV